jgi:hypothetical protein
MFTENKFKKLIIFERQKKILLLFILINLRNPAICFSSAAFVKQKEPAGRFTSTK